MGEALVDITKSSPFRMMSQALMRGAAHRETSWPRDEYMADPVGFCKRVLGFTPWNRQCEVLEAVRDYLRVAVASGHKIGKSMLAAAAALWFFCSFPDARVMMTCVTARQVEAVLYREVRRLHASSRQVGRDGSFLFDPIDGEPALKAANGLKSGFREITGFTARTPEAVAGISGEWIFYIVDEASGVEDDFFSAIFGNMASEGSRLLMLSNPTRASGEFYEAFETKAKLYKTFRISSEESPNVRARKKVIGGLCGHRWIEEKEEEWGRESPLFRIRVLGQHVKNEEGAIISIHALGLAQERWLAMTPEVPDVLAEHALGRLFVGLDPAGAGLDGDETAFCARRGPKEVGSLEVRGASKEAILVHLLGFLSQYRAPREIPVVIVDKDGQIGAPLYHELRAYATAHPEAFVVFGWSGGHPAQREPEIYGTLRDELYANGARYLREGGALRPDTKRDKDLTVGRWEPMAPSGRGASKLKATDKRDLKRLLGGRSPDRGDAWLLSVWEPSVLLETTDAGARVVQARVNDPYVGDASRELPQEPDRVFDCYSGGMK